MPLIETLYNPSPLFRNSHFSTIYSAKLRPSHSLQQERERMILSDDDFLDLDWSYSESSSRKAAILLHGLEGNAQRTYMKGQAKILVAQGWDIAAVNYRGCSGVANAKYLSYNAGKTDDLEAIIEYILEKNRYNELALIGFSLGGNLLLKYLGERTSVPKEVKKAVAISSPLSLKGSLEALTAFHNWVYRTSFLYDLKKKYRIKMWQFPDKANASNLNQIKSLLDFDNIYTAPAHGFKDAFDYYEKNSCGQFLPNIKIPILLLNALNDTFLSSACYPFELASKRENFYLETPKYGGHVGFHQSNSIYYSEMRTADFLNNH